MKQVYFECTDKSTLNLPAGELFVYSASMAIEEQTVGDRVRQLRLAAEMTMDGLAALFVSDKKPLGLTKQAVQAWEEGRNHLRADQIIRMCEIFSVTPDFLLLGKTSRFSPSTLKFAENYEKLDETQRRHFDQIYMLVRTAATDERVQQAFNDVPKEGETVKYGRRAGDK